MDTNPVVMPTLLIRATLGWAAITSLAGPLAAQSPNPPSSAEWTEYTTRTRCEAPLDSSPEGRLRDELKRLQPLDSAAAVVLALRALGGRGAWPKAVVTAYSRYPEGILIQFDLTGRRTPEDFMNIRDGTATVYVNRARCVTLLGP